MLGVTKQVALCFSGATAVDVGLQATAHPGCHGWLHILIQICRQRFCGKTLLPYVALRNSTEAQAGTRRQA